MSAYTSGNTTNSVASTGANYIDSLLSGVKWGGSIGSGMALTFSFPWTTNSTALWQSNYSYENEPAASTHYGLSSAQQAAAISALQSWANVANVTFTKISETGNQVGDIRFGFSSDVAVADSWGWCYYPNSYWASGGDVWIATGMAGVNMDFSLNGFGYSALIHELGHGLGLKHPGNYDGGESGPFLPSSTDNTLYSIMSYNDPANNLWYDTQTSKWVSLYDQTPMIYDIAAIQYMYGVNTSYHSSDDTYTFDGGPFRMTIWDAGGNDTISVENSIRSSLIDLHEGSYSSIQTTRFYSQNGISATYDGSYNLGIAYGVLIENAIGGSASDTLIGNDANNILIGNSGNDSLLGGKGADTIHGGDGDDTIYGNKGYDFLYGDGGNDTINGGEGVNTIDGGDGIDTVDYSQSTLSVNVNLLAGTTTGFSTDTLINIENITGGLANDTLTGNDIANVINGGAGIDTINGGKGTDTIYSGDGDDILFGNKGFDFLYGGNGNDILNGNVGNDTLTGGSGNDNFVFINPLSVTNNVDTITDFSSVDDTIQLSKAIFTALTATGTLSSDNFVASTDGAAVDANDYILYNTTTGALYYDADGSGSGAAVEFAILGTSSHPTITNADSVII